jgi:DNA primase
LLNASASLIDILWMRETEGHVFDTPERRAALEQRLSTSVQAIGDASLRRHYEQDVWVRLRGLFDTRAQAKPFSRRIPAAGRRFGRNGAPVSKGGPVEISATLSRSPLLAGRIGMPMREALILLVLINHPALIGVHAEELAHLDLTSAEARRLCDFLVRHGGETADPSELETEMDSAGYEPLRRRLQNLTALSSLWSVRPEASDADAEATLKQALVLHRRSGALHTELQRAEAALAQEASEHNLARLRDIQAQLSALEGTEAVIEGFGEASGRHRRDL